ncbi:MAG: hypothetical protein L3J35_10380 [Bacteroidales bacterium]|nr:hypothetical protein [Bacteroidales bacterium]
MKKNITVSLVVSIIFGIIGFFLSQYYPVFGSFIEKLGQPFSPARKGLILGHVISAVIIGFFIPFIIMSLNKKKENE